MTENIKDVEYIEVSKEEKENKKNIYGRVKYYTRSQVANELGLPATTVGYYATQFEDLLDYPVVNKQKRFIESDIEKLKFFCELKNDGMSIQQIKDYCANVDFNEKGVASINPSNPLSIQTLAKALLEEQSKQIEQMKEEILFQFDKKLELHLKNQMILNEKQIEDIDKLVCVTVDEVVSNSLETHHKALQEDLKVQSENILQNQIKGITGHFEGIIKQHNNDIVERDIKITNQLHEVLALRKKEIMEKELEQQESKGFFKKLFGK